MSQHVIQVLNHFDQVIFMLEAEEKILHSADADEPGRIELMIGNAGLTIYIGQHMNGGPEGTHYVPNIISFEHV